MSEVLLDEPKTISVGTELKTAILTLLENGGQLNMDADLACYSTHDGYYFVEYFYNESTIKSLNLTEHEKKLLEDEDELIEIFDSPEEAMEFYLRLTNGKMMPLPDHCRNRNNKKTVKERLQEKSLEQPSAAVKVQSNLLPVERMMKQERIQETDEAEEDNYF